MKIGQVLKMSALAMETQENVYEAVVIRGIEYKSDTQGNLYRFNSKHKMWVKLSFAETSQSNSILDILTSNYIKNATKLQPAV